MYKIRKAKPEDINGLINLGKSLVSYEQKLEPELHTPIKNPDAGFRKYFEMHIRKKTSLVLLAEHKNKPIGYLAAKVQKRPPIFKLRKVVEIMDIFVSGGHRNIGIGKNLVKCAISYYSKLGFGHFTLFVLSENRNAEKFYKRLGFKEIVKEMYKKTYST